MKGGCVAGFPVECRCPPSVCRCPPPSRLLGGLVEWRGVCVVVLPRVRIGSGTLCCPAPFHIVCSPRIVPALLFCLCVCCHSIVGLGLCLCDRVVSLWNGDVDLCVGRKGVWCLLFTVNFLCVVLWRVEWRWCVGV